MNGYDFASVVLIVLALSLGALLVWKRSQVGMFLESILEHITARVQTATRRRLLKIKRSEGREPAETAAANAKQDHDAAIDAAMAEAIRGAGPDFRLLAVSEAGRVSEARGAARAAAEAAAATPHYPVRDFLSRSARELAALGAVCVVISLIVWGGVALDTAHTSPHFVSGAVVCRVYLDHDYDPAKAVAVTSAGNFSIDPLRFGNTEYRTSVAASSLLHRGQIIDLYWHGGAVESAYLYKFKEVSPTGGSCRYKPKAQATGIHEGGAGAKVPALPLRAPITLVETGNLG